MTIEHIAPQSSATNGVSEKACGMMGNLLLVSEPLNTHLGNKSFSQKQTLLVASDVPVDEIIRKSKSWSQLEIEQRTEFLAKLAYGSVFKFK